MKYLIISNLNGSNEINLFNNNQEVQLLLHKKLNNILIQYVVGEKPGLVVRAVGSRPRGRGFESRRILDRCKRC